MKGSMQISNVIVGIDLHPDSFAAAVATGTTVRDVKVHQSFTKLSIDCWDHFLQNQIPKGSKLIFEASANTFEFAAIAERHGHEAIVLASDAIKKGKKRICKNDRNDAKLLVNVYLSCFVKEVWKPDSDTRLYRELESGYNKAVSDFNRANNRLKTYLSEHKIRLAKPHHLRKVATRKWILESYPWDDKQKFMLNEQFCKYDQAKACRQRYLEQIAKVVTETPYIAQLLKLCGVGLLSAFSIIAAVGTIDRFKSPKKLVAYIGLAPTIEESGNSKKKSGTQKGGRVSVKSKLIQAAHSIIKSRRADCKKLRDWGLKLTMKKCRNTAAVAVARKLVVAIWYALKGHMPEILNEQETLRKEIREVAKRITKKGVQAINYENIKEFVDKNMERIMATEFCHQELRL